MPRAWQDQPSLDISDVLLDDREFSARAEVNVPDTG
jgi:hypothetical protein